MKAAKQATSALARHLKRSQVAPDLGDVRRGAAELERA
jgi:hypothetical protein